MTEAMGQPKRWSYDVFLSFCDNDVLVVLDFVYHLYSNLERSGVYAFRDDVKLEYGESIFLKLLKAIEYSKIFLVVLSTNYGSVSCCLKELVHIMECHRSNSGHVVFPIFYGVDPSDVRRQKGSFGASFYKNKRFAEESTLQKWKEAFAQIGSLAGFHSLNYRNDVDMIDHVTREILKVLPSSYLHLPTHTVGIRSRVHRINELMCFGLDDVQIIGICGMGGVGKTTLAKAAYNEFSDRFEGTCFLENFGEYSKKPEGKVHLQQQLLSDILKTHDIMFNNMDHAVKQRFRNKRVLIVIDDVKDMIQLNSIAIDLSCFGPGSRIIITCRNKHLLEQLGVENIYSPEELDDGESLELVSWHAFRTSEPPELFLQLSGKLVEYCGGLPLAMEVLGAFLFKRSISEWQCTLELLKQTPDADIQAKLRSALMR